MHSENCFFFMLTHANRREVKIICYCRIRFKKRKESKYLFPSATENLFVLYFRDGKKDPLFSFHFYRTHERFDTDIAKYIVIFRQNNEQNTSG